MNRLDPSSRQDDLEAFSTIVRSIQAKGHDRDSQKFLNEAAKFYAISGERVKAELRLHSGERKLLTVPPDNGSQFARMSTTPLANKVCYFTGTSKYHPSGTIRLNFNFLKTLFEKILSPLIQSVNKISRLVFENL